MAKKPIDYMYSAYSAYAYIGHGAFLKIAKEANRPVIHRPFDLMKCLNAIGYHPLEERTEASLAYQFSRQRDRWSEFRNVPMPKATPSSHSCLGPLKLCHYLLTKGVTENGTETVFG